MSGRWRITVDSWVSDRANWFGHRVYVLDGKEIHNQPDALRVAAALPSAVFLDEGYYSSQLGSPPAVDVDTERLLHPGMGEEYADELFRLRYVVETLQRAVEGLTAERDKAYDDVRLLVQENTVLQVQMAHEIEQKLQARTEARRAKMQTRGQVEPYRDGFPHD